MNIHIAKTDAEINACYPVMRELRPHIAKEHFLARVRAQERMSVSRDMPVSPCD